MSYIIEGNNVYSVDERGNRFQFGTVNKTKVERIGTTDTVEDVEYMFIINADGSGEYVEVSRTTRNEPEPPEPETAEQKLAKLETDNTALREQVAQTNADFTAFTDFYFEKNPTQA